MAQSYIDRREAGRILAERLHGHVPGSNVVVLALPRGGVPVKKMSRGAPVLPFNLALVCLGLGDHARTLDNLARAVAADSQMMAWLGRDAIFNPLRSEPRFIALMKRLNFVGKA